jgi:hypothetical protein
MGFFDDIWSGEIEEREAEIQENIDTKSNYSRGLASGVDNLQATGYGFAGLMGDILGFDSLRDWGVEGYERNLEEAELNPVDVSRFTDIDSVSDGVKWFLGNAGSLTPSMAEAALSAVAGATIAGAPTGGAGAIPGAVAGAGSRTLARKLLKNQMERIVKKQIEKGVSKDVAEKVAAKSLGAKVGLMAGVTPMESGGNYGEDVEKHGVEEANPYSALGTGTAAAALELVSPSGKFFTRAVGGEGLERTAKEVSDPLLKRLVKEAPKAIAGEGTQEAAQGWLSLLNERINDPNVSFTDKEAVLGYVNDFAAGAGGGVLFGGVNAVAPGKPGIDDNTVAKAAKARVDFKNATTVDEVLSAEKTLRDIDSEFGTNFAYNNHGDLRKAETEVAQEEAAYENEMFDGFVAAQNYVQKRNQTGQVDPNQQAFERELAPETEFERATKAFKAIVDEYNRANNQTGVTDPNQQAFERTATPEIQAEAELDSYNPTLPPATQESYERGRREFEARIAQQQERDAELIAQNNQAREATGPAIPQWQKPEKLQKARAAREIEEQFPDENTIPDTVKLPGEETYIKKKDGNPFKTISTLKVALKNQGVDIDRHKIIEVEGGYAAVPLQEGEKQTGPKLRDEELHPAFDVMERQMKEGDVSRSPFMDHSIPEAERGPTVSTNPEWIKQKTIKEFNQKYGTDIKISKADVTTIFKKIRNGDKLTARQLGQYDYLKDVAENLTKHDPELVRDAEFTNVEQQGIELTAPQDVLPGTLSVGEKVAVMDASGMPDVVEMKGQKNGRAVLQDGMRIEIDPNEPLEVIGLEKNREREKILFSRVDNDNFNGDNGVNTEQNGEQDGEQNETRAGERNPEPAVRSSVRPGDSGVNEAGRGEAQAGLETKDVSPVPVSGVSEAAPRTRAERFREWFGKSQVADESGQPKIFYHGSPSFGIAKDKPWIFDQSQGSHRTGAAKSALGTYFTNDRTEATGYSRATGNVKDVFLRVENPKRINSWQLNHIKTPEDALAYRKQLEELGGYDGIYLKDEGHYIIFDSNQAKLTTNPQFGDSKDIRYRRVTGPTVPAADLGATIDESRRAEAQEIEGVFGEGFSVNILDVRNHIAGAETERARNPRTPLSDIELTEALSAIFNKEVVWVEANKDGQQAFHGFVRPGDQKKIYIDIQSRKPFHSVLGHELTHHIEQDSEVFNALWETVSPLLKDVEKYKARFNDKLGDVEAQREIVADLMGDAFGDQKFWGQMAEKNPSKFQQVANAVLDWINDMIKRIGGAEDFGSKRFVSDLHKTRAALLEAANQYAEKQGGVNEFATQSEKLTEAKEKISRLDAFKRWFGDSKVVDYDGDPLVVMHGTTHIFDQFGGDIRSLEGDMGAGFYFSDSVDDVNANYAKVDGPDLTGRIERRAEQIAQEIEYNDPEEFGLTEEDLDNPDLIERKAKELARKELAGEAPSVIPAYLSFQNPVIIGGRDETVFDSDFVRDEDDMAAMRDEAWGEIKEDNDLEDSDKQDYADEIEYRATELYDEIYYDFKHEGKLVDIVEAVADVAYEFDVSLDKDELLQDLLGDEGWGHTTIRASDLIGLLKQHDGLAEAMDYDHPDAPLAANEIIRRAFERAGFDGIIDHTVSKKFRNMEGLYDDTTHYIAFKPESVKSIFNTKWDGSNPDFIASRVVPEPTSSSTRMDRVKDYLEDKYGDKWEEVRYMLQDKNISLKKLVDALGITEDHEDVYLIESNRPKVQATKVRKLDEEHVQPLLEKIQKVSIDGLTADDLVMSESEFAEFNKLKDNQKKIKLVERYALAYHAGEANEQLVKANARRFLDLLANAAEPVDGRRIRADIERADRELLDTEAKRSTYLTILEREMRDGLKNEAQQEIAGDWLSFIEKPSGMTNGVAQSIKENFADARDLEGIRQTIRSLNDKRLDILVEAGLVEEAEVEIWKQTYSEYVPLYREGKGANTSATGRVTGPIGKLVKARGGSSREVENILAHTIDNLQSAIIQAEKAKTGAALLELGKKYGHKYPEFLKIKEVKKSPGYDNDGNIRFFNDMSESANEYKFKVNGKQHILEVEPTNPQAMRLIRGLKMEDQGGGGKIINTLGKFTRLLSALNTTYSPEFMVSNFFRDIQTAAYNLTDTEVASMKKSVIKNVLSGKVSKGIWEAMGGEADSYWAKAFKDFEENGGRIGWSDHHSDIKDLAKKLSSDMNLYSNEGKHIPKQTFEKFRTFMDRANTSVENAVRLSAYQAAVESGVSKARAAAMAADLTVDFTKKGAMGSEINALWMFANAGIQGSTRILKAAKNKQVQKMMAATIGAGVAMHIANMNAGDDDDGIAYYDKLEDHAKERNLIFIIPGTGGDYVKIPLPWGFNVLWNIGDEIGKGVGKKVFGGKNYKDSSDFDAMGSAARLALTTMNAFNPLQAGTLMQTLSPTVSDPFVQIAENKAWHGGQLMPAQNPFAPVEKPDSQLYWSTARSQSKAFAEKLNELTGGNRADPGAIDISPESIDVFIDTFTGSAGRFLADLVGTPLKALSGEDVDASEIPFARRLYGEKSEYTDGGLYRENEKIVLGVEAQIKEYGNDADMLKKIREDNKPLLRLIPVAKATKKKIKKLKAKKRLSEQSGATKEVLERTDSQIEDLYQEFNKKYRDAL